MKVSFKERLSKMAKEVLTILKGILVSLIGFINLSFVLLGYKGFTLISTSASWKAIGIFFGIVALLAVFLSCSYIFGIFTGRAFKSKKSK